MIGIYDKEYREYFEEKKKDYEDYTEKWYKNKLKKDCLLVPKLNLKEAKAKRKEYDRQRWIKNKDRLTKQVSEWRNNHKEYWKQYRIKNKDELKKQCKVWIDIKVVTE